MVGCARNTLVVVGRMMTAWVQAFRVMRPVALQIGSYAQQSVSLAKPRSAYQFTNAAGMGTPMIYPVRNIKRSPSRAISEENERGDLLESWRQNVRRRYGRSRIIRAIIGTF